MTPLEDDPLDGNYSGEMYLDDMVSSEACVRGNEERLLVATKSAVSDHIRMLGRSQDNPVPITSTAKLTNWMVAQEVLGFVIDTQSMRISSSKNRRDPRTLQRLSGLGGTWFGGCNSGLVWRGITILAKPQR